MATAEQVYQQIQQRLAQTIRELPAIVANEAVNFTLDNFEREAWLGNTSEPWQKRKNPTKWGKRDETDRALLVKTGKLKRSIRSRTEEDRAFLIAGGADVPYARVHNEGFKGKVTQQVDEHLRRNKKGGFSRVSAFTRTINQNIPRRKFMGGEGESPYLKAKIRRAAIAHFRSRMKL